MLPRPWHTLLPLACSSSDNLVCLLRPLAPPLVLLVEALSVTVSPTCKSSPPFVLLPLLTILLRLFGGSRPAEAAPPPAESAPVNQQQAWASNAAAQAPQCSIEAKDFTKCLDATNDFQSCSYYLGMFSLFSCWKRRSPLCRGFEGLSGCCCSIPISGG